MSAVKQNIANIAEICARQNLTEAIISPGSRSVPLTLAFLRHPAIQCRAVVDERSAAFVALGMAQQLKRPVILVCTSGTAALNYAPAIAEAYYQRVPLLVITADRPPEWVGQNDGQTLNQYEVFRNFCRRSFSMPMDDGHPDTRWHAQRLVSDAIAATGYPCAGPVHINVPLREPLYPDSGFHFEKDVKTISVMETRTTLPESLWEELVSIWQQSERPMIVAGLQNPDVELAQNLTALQRDCGGVLLADVTANLQSAGGIQHFDMILSSDDSQLRQALAPDLLISLGGAVVSKSLKVFLRRFKPPRHWQLDADCGFIDTFQSLTDVIPLCAGSFFAELVQRLRQSADWDREAAKAYRQQWLARELDATAIARRHADSCPASELAALRLILDALPVRSGLQLGNSSVVRWANYLGIAPDREIRVNSNRGVSGIDGTLSTAIGAATVTEQCTTLVTGDLAFFYDRNGLWQAQLPSNLKIIVFNNAGGGIFRLLDGARSLPESEREAFFATTHQRNARATAQEHNLDYHCCQSAEELSALLPGFFQASGKPSVLEIIFDADASAQAFLSFKHSLGEIR